jgi:hypothetical protein
LQPADDESARLLAIKTPTIVVRMTFLPDPMTSRSFFPGCGLSRQTFKPASLFTVRGCPAEPRPTLRRW